MSLCSQEGQIKWIMSLVSVICVKGSPLKACASWHVYSFPRAAIRKYINPGDLKHQNCIIWGGRTWEIGTDLWIYTIDTICKIDTNENILYRTGNSPKGRGCAYVYG